MDMNEMILSELRLIRIALESVAPKRHQKIPQAAISLDMPESTLRKLADSGKIAVSVRSRTKIRKQYLVDVVKTRQIIDQGLLLPRIK